MRVWWRPASSSWRTMRPLGRSQCTEKFVDSLEVEESPSDREPVVDEPSEDAAADPDDAARDEHLFGIDLGPAGDRGERSESTAAPAPTPERRPTKTLTERLANAAADRDAEASDEDPDSSS